MILLKNIKLFLTYLLTYLGRVLVLCLTELIKSLPIIAMLTALYGLLCFGNEFLIKNQELLTYIDVACFTISTIHIVLFNKEYYKTIINCYFGWVLFVFWEYTDITFKLSDIVFLSGYVAILLFVILKSIKDNRK